MLQEAPVHTLPPAGDPTECVPARTGCVGQLLWTRTGTPGQHLGGRDEAEKWNRYSKRKLESRGNLTEELKSHAVYIAHDFLWFFSLINAWSISCSRTCWSGCGASTHMWSISVSAAKYMSTVTEFGCVPVSTLFYTEKSGWVVTRSVQTHDNSQEGSTRVFTT